MKKILLTLFLTFFSITCFSQVAEIRKVFFNECMANRNVTASNEKYQVAYCNDIAEQGLKNLRNSANQYLSESRELKDYTKKLDGFNQSDASGAMRGVLDSIEKYKRLNQYSNPYLSTEFYENIRYSFKNLTPVSQELVLYKKSKEPLISECKTIKEKGGYCTDDNFYHWYNYRDYEFFDLPNPR